jgi:ABC-type polar amino acid transport system ATPase subunit
MFMENGYVLESGTAKDFFENPKEERTKEFIRNITRKEEN